MKRLALVAAAALMSLAAMAPAMAQDRHAEPGWITATNQDCKIWNPEPQANESVTWSGGCKDGLADGQGILRWTENGKPDVEFSGEYEAGKRNGAGVITMPDGKRTVGQWKDDEEVPVARDAI